MVLEKHTLSDDVNRRMASLPLENNLDDTMSGVECHQRPRTAHTVGRRRTWHAIISFGKHIRHLVRHAFIALGLHARLDDVGSGMQTWALG